VGHAGIDVPRDAAKDRGRRLVESAAHAATVEVLLVYVDQLALQRVIVLFRSFYNGFHPIWRQLCFPLPSIQAILLLLNVGSEVSTESVKFRDGVSHRDSQLGPDNPTHYTRPHGGHHDVLHPLEKIL